MSNPYRILFLCTGNSARSIMAEAILNYKGHPNFRGYSAGSHPSGKVHPEALKQINAAGIPHKNLRSKSWDEFVKPGAPHMDFIITVCDNAAAETCPVWSGHPATAHWGIDDPAAAAGSPEAIQRAFRTAFLILERRISLLLSLPLSNPEQFTIKQEIRKIGSL